MVSDMLGGLGWAAVTGILLLSCALRRVAPAATLGLLGAIPGGVVGFIVGASDGPAFAPAAAIVGATIGLILLGSVGVIATNSRSPQSARRRTALRVLVAGLLFTPLVPYLLLIACPLYVSHGDFCSYAGVDVLGGWVTAFTMVYVFDVLTLAGLVAASPSWPE